MADDSRITKTIKSPYDSSTFAANVSIHVDRKVGSATISPSGRDVALASTDGLDIIDLDSPLNPPRHLRHGLPWLVSDVQWSPFALRDYWVVSTANQKALVWNLNMQEDAAHGAIEHTLHAHTRAITDINFSAHHPDILATCAVDGYVHCWDLRRPRQPALTFCDWFGGATQVKYSRQDPHIIASSHDRWLRIWDDRKGAAPLRSINAHESKIYGIDWNRTRSTGIVTCSLDKSIKFWDYSNELDEPERIIRTDFPVWRARHTPFGWGLLAMPQDSPGNLHLYERRLRDAVELDCAAPAVATFPGHGNHKVKEFLWRSRGGVTDDGVDNREFQLVSWGEDNQLRLQHVDPELLEGVGYIRGKQVLKKLNVTRKGAVYKTYRSIEHAPMEKRAATITGPRAGGSTLNMSALSAGMRKMTLPQSPKSRTTGRPPAMRIKEKTSKNKEEKQKQIGWMSGIKFNRQNDAGSSIKRRASRRLSLLNPEFNGDEEWDTQESLHDEIIRIHDSLPKIHFDDVNMDKRTVVASMNGPWGESDTPIYIKVTIVFPNLYPEAKAPNFTIGKTQLMSDATYETLRRGVQHIASSFVARKRGSLEAILCYLLGEVDLAASTSSLLDSRDGDDDLDALADESSSDDGDEDIPAGASAMMSQELEVSASGELPGPVNRNVNVPLPRLCGARFSPNGKLVCFFPPKEDKVKSLLETLVTTNNARSKGEPTFETFGRLHNNNSPQPVKSYSITSESRSESDDSGDSDDSLSSDSDTFHIPRIHMVEYFRRSTIKRGFGRNSPVPSQRSSAGGTNTGTGTGTGISKARPPKPKNRLSVHDLSDILPSKRFLAQEYAIFGEGPDVCEKNAQIAAKHGLEQLADIWRYAATLLQSEVPLELIHPNRREESVFVVAKGPSRKKRSDSGSDSGVDVSFDASGDRNSLSARVKWGASPLAKDLISGLFAQFEEVGDIQMLAMLSCIFSEPSVEIPVQTVELQMPQPQTPLTMKTPAFSLEYFPTDAISWVTNQRTPTASAVSTPKLSQTPSGLYGSMGSSNGAWGSDPASGTYSCGETPPLISNRGSSEQLDRHAQSLSTSPDNPRSFRRANSGLASSFAASFSRPFSLVSSSPPNPSLSRKKPSPVENVIHSLTPSTITWGNTTVLGSVKEQATTPRSSYSEDDRRKSGWKPTVCVGISVAMTNQDTFDDEGYMSTSLLEPSKADVFASYRSAYAELLFLWGLPLARLEILKFNGLKDHSYPNHTLDEHNVAGSVVSVESNRTQPGSLHAEHQVRSRKEQENSLRTPESKGLDTTGYCLKHEVRLQPLSTENIGGAVGSCERCKTIQRQLRCTVCHEPVIEQYVPCLSCGCVSHRRCLQEYHAIGSTECAGGCDCDCGLNSSLGIVESWDVMIDIIERMRQLHGDAVDERDDENNDFEDKSDWERVIVPPTSLLAAGAASIGAGLSKRIGAVRSAEWGVVGGLKRPSSLRNQDIS